MESKNNIIALLQPLAPKENFVADKVKNSGGEDQFQNMLEEASRKVKRAEEGAQAKGKDENKSVQSNKKQNTEKSSNSVDHQTETGQAGEAGENQQQINNESFESKLAAVNQDAESASVQNQDALEGKLNSLVESKDLIVERLQSLGIAQETIEALLKLLEIEGTHANAQELLLELAGQLNLLQNDSLKQSLLDAKGGQESTAVLRQEQLAIDFMRKAGIDETEIRNLVQKILQAKANANNTQQTLTDKVKDGAGDFAKQAASATQIVNDAAQAKARESQLDISPKLGQQQESERFKTPDPSVKVLRTVSLQNNNAAGEIKLPAALLNLQNPQESFSTLNQGTSKVPAEVLVQHDAGVTQKLSNNNLEGLKSAAKEVFLPRGISEKGVVDQIVQKFSIRGSGNQNEIKIKLDPPSLGTIRMNISTSGNTVKTTIITESLAVKHIIESNLSQLKDSITGQGLKTGEFTVLVGGESGFAGQNQQQPGAGHFGGNAQDDPLTQDAMDAPAHEEVLHAVGIAGNISVFA